MGRRDKDASKSSPGHATGVAFSPGGHIRSQRLAVEPGAMYVVRFLNSTLNKALHIGHLRNIALGTAAANSLELLGHRVIRHCVLEDIGRFVAEAMAGLHLVDGWDQDGWAPTEKPDHFMGQCYARYRQLQGMSEATTSYADDRGPAEDLMRRWQEPEVRRLWRKVCTLSLEGQEHTLRRLKVRFDCCDYESAEEPTIEEFRVQGVRKGIFELSSEGELVFRSTASQTLRLANRAGYPEENLRLLSFLTRTYKAWAVNRRNVIMAGSEWAQSMSLYAEILRRLGIDRSHQIYRPMFYGMVTMNGRKMASSSRKTVLIDDLLRSISEARQTEEIVTASNGDMSGDDVAALVAKGYLLSFPRTATIDFSLDHVLSADANPGWTIAHYLALPGDERARSGIDVTTDGGQDEAASMIRSAVEKISFEWPLTRAAEMARRAVEQNEQEPILTRLVTALGFEKEPFALNFAALKPLAAVAGPEEDQHVDRDGTR